jgi:hypothetical protein
MSLRSLQAEIPYLSIIEENKGTNSSIPLSEYEEVMS